MLTDDICIPRILSCNFGRGVNDKINCVVLYQKKEKQNVRKTQHIKINMIATLCERFQNNLNA